MILSISLFYNFAKRVGSSLHSQGLILFLLNIRNLNVIFLVGPFFKIIEFLKLVLSTLKVKEFIL